MQALRCLAFDTSFFARGGACSLEASTTAGAGFTHGRAFCLVSRELRPQGTLISHGGGFARGRSGDEGRETEHVSRQRAPSALVVRTRCRRDACG
jgi:hypothetical protein